MGNKSSRGFTFVSELHTLAFREAVADLHDEAWETLGHASELVEDEDGVLFASICEAQDALDGMLEEFRGFADYVGISDGQRFDAACAVGRLGTSRELGSDNALILATIRGVRLDDEPIFGVPSVIALAAAKCKIDGCNGNAGLCSSHADELDEKIAASDGVSPELSALWGKRS